MGPYGKSLDVGAILVKEPKRQTRIWKRTIQCLFDQTLVLILQMVSEKMIFMLYPAFQTSDQDGRHT
jgi:hypothetical protein